MNGFNKRDKTTNPLQKAPYRKVKESLPSNNKLHTTEEADPILISLKFTPHKMKNTIHTNPTNSSKTVKSMNSPKWNKAKKPIKKIFKNLPSITNPNRLIKFSLKKYLSQNPKTSKVN